MALTPLDILQKEFGPARTGAGYDAEEVHRFLQDVHEAWNASVEENLRQREELTALDEAVEALRGEQDEIRQTLILAHRMALDLENTARREVDVLVGEARLEAERILAAAHEERRSLQEDLWDPLESTCRHASLSIL